MQLPILRGTRLRQFLSCAMTGKAVYWQINNLESVQTGPDLKQFPISDRMVKIVNIQKIFHLPTSTSSDNRTHASISLHFYAKQYIHLLQTARHKQQTHDKEFFEFFESSRA